MLDTNAASDVIKGTHPTVRARLRTQPGPVYISAITEGELRLGLAKRPETTKLAQTVEAFLATGSVLAFDSDAAIAYGHVRATLEARGQPLGANDMLIAAHALSRGLTLVTADKAFSRVDGLSVEDWSG